MKKGLLSILLVCVMLVSLLPTMAWATEPIGYEWDTLVFTKTSDGSKLVEGTDYTVTHKTYNTLDGPIPYYNEYFITTTDPVTISGGGSYARDSYTTWKCTVEMNSNADSNVTLKDVTCLGTLTAQTGYTMNVTLEGTNNVDSIIGSDGTSAQTSLVFGGTGTLNGKHIGGKYGANVTAAEITINSGTYDINVGSERYAAIGGGYSGSGSVKSYADGITINGGTITAKGGYGAAIGGGQYGDARNITIAGGTINATGSYGAGIGSGMGQDDSSDASALNMAENITITGGNITAVGSSGAAIGGGSYAGAKNITISGGTVNASVASQSAYAGAAIGGGAPWTPNYSYTEWVYPTTENIDISGGTVTASAQGTTSYNKVYIGHAVGYGTFNNTGSNFRSETATGVEICCGTYNMDPSAFVPTGYKVKDNGDGTWTVEEVFVAQVGETKYGTFTAALNAAKSGNSAENPATSATTITLLEDVTLSGTMASDSNKALYNIEGYNNIVIDGNGHKFILKDIVNNSNKGGYVFTVRGPAEFKNVTVERQGTWTCNKFGGFLNVTAGETKLTNCNIDLYAANVAAGEAWGCFPINIGSVTDTPGAVVTVNGGTYTGGKANGEDNKGIAMDAADATLIFNSGTTNGIHAEGAKSVEIKGGTHTGTQALRVTKDANVTVTGGTFGVDPTSYVPATGYKVEQKDENTWVVGEGSDSTVIFVTNGGSLVDEQTVAFGGKVDQTNDKTATTRSGYVFDGWYTDEGLNNAYDFNSFVTAPLTLYAKWTANGYTIAFDVDGGSAVASIATESDKTETLPTPTKNGYTFAGWKDPAGTVYAGGTKVVNLCTGEADNNSITLTAQWKPNSYRVTFDANGGVCVTASKTVISGGTYGKLPTPTHPYAEFAGWYTAASGGTKIEETDNAPVTNTTLYAHWTPKTFSKTLTGFANDTTPTYGTDFVLNVVGYESGKTYDVTVTVGGKSYIPVNNGDGTYTIPGEDVTEDIVATCTLSESNYVTLTYVFDGKAVAAQKVLKTGTYPEVALPTLAGYTVTGWYDAAEGGNELAGEINLAKTTLYAHKTINNYDVSYNSDSGSAVADASVKFGNNIEFPTSVPTRGGYTFLGWKGDNGVTIPYSGGKYTVTYAMPAKDVEFTAIWQAIPTGDLQVKVTDANGAVVVGAKVRLMQGSTVLDGSGVTDEAGVATFNSLPYGAYNVEVTNSNDVTTTKAADLYSNTVDVPVTVPVVKFNTKVASEELNATVENLENAIPASEKSKITDNTSGVAEIVVTLTATKTTDEATDMAITDDNKNVKDTMNQVVEAQNTEEQTQKLVEYVDVTLTQVEKNEDGSQIGDAKPLTTTTQIQTISFEITNDLYAALAAVDGGMENIIAYRLHNGRTQKLNKVAQSNGETATYECYWVKTVEGVSYIVVKANQFSTYAFGVQNTEVENYVAPTPTYSGGGGSSTYAVTAESAANGKVSVDKKNASSGSTVTVTVKPDAEYKLGTLTAKDAKGNAVTLTKVNDTTYTFKMPAANVTVSATFVKTGACPQDATCVYAKFTDADTKEWYHDGVHFCVEKGYMVGVAADKFAPSGTLSRAMIVTMLWRMEDSPVANYVTTFKDVPADQWYTEAIRWAQSNKIVEGYNADSFGPDDNVTREQLAAILMRYAAFKGIDVSARADLAKFTDTASISDWAVENIKWANAIGIINGRTETTIVPTGNATRAEAACMVQRFCETVLK